MKKSIFYTTSIIVVAAALQYNPITSFAQAKITKSTTAAKLKGTFEGHYGLGSQIGEYQLSFYAGKYSGIFISNNGDREAIVLTDLTINESLRTIIFKKGKDARIYKGKITKDFHLLVDGKQFENFQQDAN